MKYSALLLVFVFSFAAAAIDDNGSGTIYNRIEKCLLATAHVPEEFATCDLMQEPRKLDRDSFLGELSAKVKICSEQGVKQCALRVVMPAVINGVVPGFYVGWVVMRESVLWFQGRQVTATTVEKVESDLDTLDVQGVLINRAEAFPFPK